MKRDFQKLIKELNEEELREEMQVLYDRFPAIREYYKMELGANTKALVDKYKKDLHKSFFPTRGYRMNRRGRSASNKVIKAFAEISIHSKDLIGLHFYRVEVMIEAAEHFLVENESFFDSIISSFAKACAMAEKEILLDAFQDSAKKLVKNAPQHYASVGYNLQAVYRQYWK